MKLYISKRTRSEDVECIILAKLGFSRKCIAARTGLSEGQISTRIKIAGVRLADYRNGETHLANSVIEAAHQDSTVYFNEVKQQIQQLLKNGKGH